MIKYYAQEIDGYARYDVGDTITDFRGESHVIAGFSPAVGRSTGRVYVERDGRTQGFYPSVFNVVVFCE
jgi:hypothetical protein